MPARGPRYAICITNYNSGRTIREAMSGVLRQMPSNLAEIVVTDNESTDDSLPYLKQLLAAGRIQALKVERSTLGGGRKRPSECRPPPTFPANSTLAVASKQYLLEALRPNNGPSKGRFLTVIGMLV